jgi:hypothetical protein
MSRLIDMTGWIMSEHGVPDSKLIVIRRVEDKITPNGCVKPQWLCECMCEQHNQLITTGERIRNGISKSCGCLKIEKSIERIKEVQHISAELKKKYNEYTLYDTYGVGKYFNCDDVFYFSIEDYDIIKEQCWSKSYGYARAHIKNTCNESKEVTMHELIGCKNHDHINRNRSDNRRENLRPATIQENTRNRGLQSNNTSGITGVTWKEDKKKWKAYISINKRQIHLGYFIGKDDAICARLKAEAEYFKEFAPQIYLFEEYGIEY